MTSVYRPRTLISILTALSMVAAFLPLLPRTALGASPGDLVINEIIQNPSAVSDSNGEWFELVNTTGADIDIDGWTIADDDTDSHVISNGGPLLVPANGYLVLGINGDSASNGGVTVDYTYADVFLGNGADELVLTDTTATEIDRVNWDDGITFPDPNGASMALDDPANENNVGANWCESSTVYGAGDLGTPGAANDCGTEPPPPPPPSGVNPGDVVINEIIQNPDAVSDSNGEWFELVNTTTADIDIDGWTISDDDFDSHVINNGGPLVVPANDYLVLGINGDTSSNGGVTVDYTYTGLFLSNGADELVLSDPGAIEIDRVNWDGGPAFPDPTGASMALDDPANENNVGSNWCESSTPFGAGDLGTPGAANDCGTEPPPPPTFGVCGDPATLIHLIQGSGSASLLDGESHEIEGVVVGDFQATDGTGLRGFYLQEEDTDADADPLTSEGIFVFDNGFGVDVSIGDQVRVAGVVDEFFGLTQITDVADVAVCGPGEMPAATPRTLPVTDPSDWEAVEGMLVTLPQALHISEYFNYDRFGQVVLTTDRQFQPTELYAPGSPEAAALDLANDLSRIMLDDGQSDQNPDYNRHPDGSAFGLDNSFRGGDTLTDVTGVVDYSFGSYKIQPTTVATHTELNTRPTRDARVRGRIDIASFNVLNFFATVDNGPDVCGPPGTLDCRGADSQEEFDRQLAKLIPGILALDAEIVGLQEVENGVRGADGIPAHDAIIRIVDELNAVEGAGTWAWVGEPVLANGDVYYNDYPIRNEIIYRTDAVTPIGPARTIQSDAFDLVRPGSTDPVGRPPVAQTFAELSWYGHLHPFVQKRFTVVVNHFKSKGSSCDSIGDPNIGDGQGNCNLTRVAQSEALLEFVDDLRYESYDPDVLIIGDLNSYGMEDPVTTILDAGFVDVVDRYEGDDSYTFVFDGQLGSLDHALASRSMRYQVRGALTYDINVDEPDILDYDTSFKSPNQDAMYEPLPYRVSDHDPVVVGVNPRSKFYRHLFWQWWKDRFGRFKIW